tara:strand:+ start:2329 stop:2553 length:225 start_codon:yes stop_codon:yes gene_type:complete
MKSQKKVKKVSFLRKRRTERVEGFFSHEYKKKEERLLSKNHFFSIRRLQKKKPFFQIFLFFALVFKFQVEEVEP